VDFELTKVQKDIQRAARDFAKGEFDKELALRLEEEHEFPTDIWHKAGEEGFIGLDFPEEFGGSGYGYIEKALVIEEFCRRDSGLGTVVLIADFASPNIVHFGNEEQKKRYLEPVAEGRSICGGAFTEPNHGSDLAQLDTSAVPDGDDWILNGVKTFITSAGIADHYVVLCQTDHDARHKGQTMFVVDADSPGLEVADVGGKMGMRMVPTGELSFKDVRVPGSNLLGEVGRGFMQVMKFFDESRIGVAAQAVGIAQGAFDRALTYVKGREQFGKKIAQFQVTQHKLVDMALQIEMARLITHKAAWTVDRGKPDSKVTAMAKVQAAHTAIQVANEAIQLLGGYGYMTEFEVERFFRDARVTDIYEGTREIQKNVIAAALLGRLRR